MSIHEPTPLDDILDAPQGKTDPQWTERDLLVSAVCTQEEILTELRKANSVERTGSVSSVEIKTSARGHDITVKAYTGSDILEAEDAAVASYLRTEQKLKAGIAQANDNGAAAFVAEVERRVGK